MVRRPLADHVGAHRSAAGDERGAHVDVGCQVLHVGHVAVLAEEGRAGHQRAGRGGVELVGRVGEHDQVARARRVRHVGGAARAIGDVARLGLGVRAVDHLPALRLAVAGPVVRVAQRQEGGLDLGHSRGLVDCRRPAAGRRRPGRARPGSDRSAPCRRPSRPWPCRSSHPWPAGSWRSAAWRAGPGRPALCWRRWPGTAARSRGRTRRRCWRWLRHQRVDQSQGRVGALVGAPDERRALRHAAVRRAVDLHVVIGGVRQRRWAGWA